MRNDLFNTLSFFHKYTNIILDFLQGNSKATKFLARSNGNIRYVTEVNVLSREISLTFPFVSGMKNNQLSGIIPTILHQLPLVTLYLSGNCWAQPLPNYSTWAGDTDYSLLITGNNIALAISFSLAIELNLFHSFFDCLLKHDSSDQVIRLRWLHFGMALPIKEI